MTANFICAPLGSQHDNMTVRDHRRFDHDQFIAGASIKESRLLIACCIGTILSKVRVPVIRQRHHGNTAGECEDEDKCCDEDLHGSPALVRDFATSEAAVMVTRSMLDSATFRFVFVFNLIEISLFNAS
jgi:hypothetical protein